MAQQPEADAQVGIFPSDERPALMLFYVDRAEVCLRYRYGFSIPADQARAWRVVDCRGRSVEQVTDYSGTALRERGYFESRREAVRALLALILERLDTIAARRALVERELAREEGQMPEGSD